MRVWLAGESPDQNINWLTRSLLDLVDVSQDRPARPTPPELIGAEAVALAHPGDLEAGLLQADLETADAREQRPYTRRRLGCVHRCWIFDHREAPR